MDKFLTLFSATPSKGIGGRGVKGAAGIRKKLGMSPKQVRLAGTNNTKSGAARQNALEIEAGRPANMTKKGGMRKTLGK